MKMTESKECLMNIRFTLNGKESAIETVPDRRVVDLLREDLNLTGTKEGCGSGECGACTVLIDGVPRLGCLMLAAQLDGKAVTTIEGLADGKELHPIQEAFVRKGAIQCGFCSPGMMLSAAALLTETPNPSRDRIREGLSGNLCRCTGYQKIVDAVEDAARNIVGSSSGSFHAASSPAACFAKDELTDGQTLNQQRSRGTASLKAKKVFLPQSLDELWSCLEEEPAARLFAGGTDLLVQMRARSEDCPVLIGLERIAELQDVRETPSGLWIGAGNTHRRLLDDPRIRSLFPILVQALQSLGSPPIRNMGTIGGNLCTASPAGDTLPPLYVLGAEVELSTRTGRRILPIYDFIAGPGKTALKPGEILTGIRLDKPDGYDIQHYEKVGQRKALACAIAGMAALVKISPTGTIEAVRLAWGSVGPTVVTSREIEAALVGKRLSLAVLKKAATLARQAVSPIDDLRATADYRRQVSGNLLLRLAVDPENFNAKGISAANRDVE